MTDRLKQMAIFSLKMWSKNVFSMTTEGIYQLEKDMIQQNKLRKMGILYDNDP
jgi:hypothetical protein